MWTHFVANILPACTEEGHYIAYHTFAAQRQETVHLRKLSVKQSRGRGGSRQIGDKYKHIYKQKYRTNIQIQAKNL